MTIAKYLRISDEDRDLRTTGKDESDITELDRSKIEEQKKAVRAGYDIDIIPSDLATYGRDAKALLKELQSQNERMFMVTFLVMNTGRTEQELETNVFQSQSIAQKHNCVLRRLDFQQEQGLMSSLPLAQNLIEIQRGLDNQISNIESTHPGYDEYRYDLAEIGHNPYELASYLTVLFEDYTRAEVQSTLQSLFAQQYTLTLTPEVEVRYRTETRTDSEGNDYDVEVPYNYHILNVKLTNKGLGAVIRASGLTTEQSDRYDVLMTTSGNRSELFGEDVYGVSGGEYTDYDIPGEALTDEKFRRMITEAEKYLGYPYVWGGSSPSTSFDCSGFVSWVINHSGNGWNVGRLGARGLKNICDIIPPDQAKPGDLIFFHHTYDAPDPSDATHVGIYVGDGMMIHCGNPISYASTESNYWQSHFLCFGRIR